MKATFHLVVALAALFATAAARAITVDGDGDGTLAALAGNGTCELREAVAAANDDMPVDACPTGAGADAIDFAPGIVLIQLSAGQLLISSELTVSGPGSDVLLIEQLTTDARVVEVDDQTAGEATITVTGLELQGGSVAALAGDDGRGGAILNREDLTLDDVTLRANEALDGGAIFNTGTLSILSSRLLDSSAVTGSGVLACEQDAVCGLEDTVVRGGESTNGAAFGRMRQSTDLDVVRSELSDFTGPVGGHALVADNVNLNFENSTYSDADVAFLSIENGTQAELIFATVAGAGSDVFIGTATTLNVRASILEGDLSKVENPPPLEAPVVVANFSVFAQNLNTSFFTAVSGTSLGVNPQLEPLGNNGGPTRTHDLAPTSPALDRISPASNPCDRIFVDQRGLDRPHDGLCDAGAVESGTGVIFSDGFEG